MGRNMSVTNGLPTCLPMATRCCERKRRRREEAKATAGDNTAINAPDAKRETAMIVAAQANDFSVVLELCIEENLINRSIVL